MSKESILVSECLLGKNCKYNGGNNYNEAVCALSEKYNIIPVCPEVEGGLSTPREPAEIDFSLEELKVVTKSGSDVTEEFLIGAKKAVAKAKEFDIIFCILKDGSPSCGTKYIYDGTFTHEKISKMGVTARALKTEGFDLCSEDEIGEITRLR